MSDADKTDPDAPASRAPRAARRAGGRAARLAQRGGPAARAAPSRPSPAFPDLPASPGAEGQGVPPPERQGVPPTAARDLSDRVLLIACGALAREVLALIRLNGWDHLDLRCLPAKLHLRPDLIPDAVESEVTRARGEAQASGAPGYGAIKLLYADCGTGGLLQARCEALGIEMIPGPHCYAFFDGIDRFAETAEDEMTCFYLTDFLVRQFDAFVWKPMGLDRRPELREMIFGGYDRLVHLAQIDDPELDRLAQEAARRLGLRHERRLTGYGDLESFMARARPAARRAD